MLRGTRLDTASSVIKPTATASGSSHRRHGAALAWPRGPGWDTRIAVLLMKFLSGARRNAGRGQAGLAALAGPDSPARTWSAGLAVLRSPPRHRPPPCPPARGPGPRRPGGQHDEPDGQPPPAERRPAQ